MPLSPACLLRKLTERLEGRATAACSKEGPARAAQRVCAAVCMYRQLWAPEQVDELLTRVCGPRSISECTGRTVILSAHLGLQGPSIWSHSVMGGSFLGKQLQRGSLIRSQPKMVGSSLYLRPAPSLQLRHTPFF